MEKDQPRVKKHPGRHGDDHHPAFSEALNVIPRQNHRRNLQPGGGAHQDPRELVRQTQIAADPQRHIDDVHGVAGPHQRGGDKQHPDVLILPAAHLGDGLIRRLLNPGNRRQRKGNQSQADNKNACRDGKHGGKAVVQRQHECQRRANDPRQRELCAHHRAEHHHFPRRVIGVFTGQREELRHGGIRERGQQHAAGDERQVVAVEGKEQRVAHGHRAAKEDQLTAIALAVGSFRQREADQDPGNRVDGVKQPHPKRLRPHLAAEKQTQRRCLKRPCHAHHKGHQHKSGVHAVQASPHRHQPQHAQVLVKANRNWVKE